MSDDQTRGRVSLLGIEFDVRLTLLIIFSTVMPMLDYYNHNPTGTKAFDRFIFYFLGSLLFIALVYRESPRRFGLQLGNWRRGLLWTALGCGLMALILWPLARSPEMAAFYTRKASGMGPAELIAMTGIEMLGWEFIWRGLVLFGLARALGPGPAIMLQAVPFAFMHLGKPEIETLSTIFGGAAFGLVAWDTKSFAYPWLIHWFIAGFTMLVALSVA